MITFGPKVPPTDYDLNIFQGHEPICAIRCQEMILRDYGIQIPKEDLTQFATEKGWYDGQGTKLNDVGNLLEVCNIKTHSQYCDSVFDLINELKDGHRVIVAVDSHELWEEPGSKEYEFYRNLTHADHALIVTSLNIDPNNPDNSTVILTDPGDGSILEYDFERFAHSWKDSNCFMMATDEPAPYQYNAESQCMEMSNFATPYQLQEFPFHNEFSNIWQIDNMEFEPYYNNGHLTSIMDGLSYDDFMHAMENDNINMLDDLFNLDDANDMTRINISDSDIITEVTPVDNLFDFNVNHIYMDDNLS